MRQSGCPGTRSTGLGTLLPGPRHSPRLLHVGALVGGAGGRRLGEGGRTEDALRPGVQGGLQEQRDSGVAVGWWRAELPGGSKAEGASRVVSAERACGRRSPAWWEVPVEMSPDCCPRTEWHSAFPGMIHLGQCSPRLALRNAVTAPEGRFRKAGGGAVAAPALYQREGSAPSQSWRSAGSRCFHLSAGFEGDGHQLSTGAAGGSLPSALGRPAQRTLDS